MDFGLQLYLKVALKGLKSDIYLATLPKPQIGQAENYGF